MVIAHQNKLLDFIQFMNAKYRGFLFYTVLMVIVLIVFEALQQYYYILRFDLFPTSSFTFSELIIGQTYRWMIWLVVSMAYFGTIIFNGQSDYLFKVTKLWPSAFHVIVLLGINVLLVSILQLLLTNATVNLNNLWENCVFYFFQKAPIYTLAHGAMLGLFYMVNSNQNLAIEILDLKVEKKASKSETPPALSIKIGTRNKIISLQDIVWIEAYDYCVKIHTVHQHAYAMRNSLKALEKRLYDHQFLRVHRKAIVNMNKVSEVTYNSTSFLTLKDQTRVDIAQSRVKSIKTFFG